jgi:acyl-CoA hydrolase
VASAHLTFVAVDGQGDAYRWPPVIPEGAEWLRRYEDAGRRREIWRSEVERRSKHKP